MVPSSTFSQQVVRSGDQPISRLMHLALSRPELISLAAGFVDQASLPVEATGAAIASVLEDPIVARAALQYCSTPGHVGLRAAVLDRLLSADGARAAESRLSVNNVVLTAGSNQMLSFVAAAVLDPGDIVLAATPTYFVFLGILAGLGARVIGVAADEDGLIPEALEAELERLRKTDSLGRVKLLYVASYFDNPSTVTLPPQRRARIVEIIKRYSRPQPIYILEDAAYRELRYSGVDTPSMRSFDESGDTVIVAETFSKSFAPGVRVGWGVLPPSLVGPVCDLKGNFDFGSPSLNQHLMAAVLARGLFEPHLAELRRCYAAKLQAMLRAADAHLSGIEGVAWNRPSGGLYLWLRLPSAVDAGLDSPLFQSALASGVFYAPGEYFYPGEGVPVERHTIRLSFGVQSAANIERGVAALAVALREQLTLAQVELSR
jgi:2-aminoadipate transaminase